MAVFPARIMIPVLGVLLAMCALWTLMVGAADVSLFSDSPILWDIRLPRVIMGLLVGMGLAISGAVLQSLLHNPLAEPGLVGVSAGAALAVAITIVCLPPFTGMLGIYGLSIAAFAGALLTCLLIFRLSTVEGSISTSLMLLAGIAINALAGAGTGLMSYLSTDEQLRTITFWSLGSLGGALWVHTLVTASIVLPLVAVLMHHARALNLLTMGEREAGYLGVEVTALKRRMLLAVALLVGTCVANTGIIGFVGLVVPHIVRILCGADHRVVIPGSALLGGVLLLAADMLARTLVIPAELPIGILTALLGAPFFLWLLMRRFAIRG